MNETVLVGRAREIVGIPRENWEAGLAEAPAGVRARLNFMSDDHHRVRYHVVRELPRLGRPMKPLEVSRALSMPLPRIEQVLNDLEKHLFFLVRDHDGDITWAFPVTVEDTGHRLRFSTGERLDAA